MSIQRVGVPRLQTAFANLRVTAGATIVSLLLCAISSGPGTRAGSTLLARAKEPKGSIFAISFVRVARAMVRIPRIVPSFGFLLKATQLFSANRRMIPWLVRLVMLSCEKP